jgi:hypothetical protein
MSRRNTGGVARGSQKCLVLCRAQDDGASMVATCLQLAEADARAFSQPPSEALSRYTPCRTATSPSGRYCWQSRRIEGDENRPRAGATRQRGSTASPRGWGSRRCARLPPGRLRLATRPASTGSLPLPKTIGIIVVAALTVRTATVPPVAATAATRRRTRSAANFGSDPKWGARLGAD